MDLHCEFQLWQTDSIDHELIKYLIGMGVSESALKKSPVAVAPIGIWENCFDYQEDGKPHIIMPVWALEPDSGENYILDLVAWHPDRPDVYYFRKDIGSYAYTSRSRMPVEWLKWARGVITSCVYRQMADLRLVA